ncbi:ATP-binding protein [Prauserella halophila]|uniref:ATP-binding protein n=1 Tax=Prauserella halophila TaxID=185641 RepID=A0ABN1W3U5_9PSEU|nr:ATP-binding protein [Prauserella halophila]MCP2236055.1 hypothetical protein [Prauserella halophila]
MIRSFRLGNHRSFAGEGELLFMPVKEAAGSSVVPVTAIYGANASGKSNLIDGLLFMRSAVLESFGRWEVDGGVPRKPFQLGEVDEPSLFVVELVLHGVPYTYGFTVDDEAVREEWLYSYPEKRKRKIFEREGEEITFGSTVVGDLRAKLTLLEELIRPNALFLSGCANTKIDVVMPIFEWFQSQLRTRRVDARPRGEVLARQVQRFVQDAPDKRDKLITLLRAADVAISDVQLDEVDDPRAQRQLRDLDEEISELRETVDGDEEGANGESAARLRSLLRHRERLMQRKRTELKFMHDALGEPLGIDDESAGTRNWLDLLPTVLGALENGSAVVVDEIDASLHPLLTARLIGLFQDPEVNPHQAQLIFTTHDTTLLGSMLGEDVLTREQVWFVEKGAAGASSVYALSDFKPRKDQNTERRYLGGSYGAVPILDPQQFADAVLGS